MGAFGADGAADGVGVPGIVLTPDTASLAGPMAGTLGSVRVLESLPVEGAIVRTCDVGAVAELAVEPIAIVRC